MIKKKLEDALNKQSSHEAYASSSYLAMASWCEKEGLRGCAEFFYAQSEEERGHLLKLVKYINEAGGHAQVSAVSAPANSYKNLQEVFKTGLEQEMGVTQDINKIVELALQEKDYAAFTFLQWYVQEQVEEENLFRLTLDIIKLAGKEDRSWLLVDKEIGALKDEEEKEEE
ncbi:MAG: ferritin [Candidatus Omnitrophica bacterium]|nr:ferritin [Candidatus Omnitrophota bacterium]